MTQLMERAAPTAIGGVRTSSSRTAEIAAPGDGGGDRRRHTRSTPRAAVTAVTAVTVFAATGVLFWLFLGGAVALFDGPWLTP